jgi:hypothetical protein
MLAHRSILGSCPVRQHGGVLGAAVPSWLWFGIGTGVPDLVSAGVEVWVERPDALVVVVVGPTAGAAVVVVVLADGATTDWKFAPTTTATSARFKVSSSTSRASGLTERKTVLALSRAPG